MLELQLTEALLELVKSGRAVSVMAAWAVAPAVRAGSVAPVRITRKGLFRDWFAAVPERLRGSRPVGALVRMLKRDALSMPRSSAPPSSSAGSRRRAATARCREAPARGRPPPVDRRSIGVKRRLART